MDARREDLEAFLGELLQRRAPETVATRYRRLRVLYRWLEEEEDAGSPMARMRPPIVPEQPVPVVPEDGLRRLLTACAGRDFEASRDTAVVTFLLDCWFCPGGGLETGEGYEQAARRELFEETGIVAEELGSVVLERTVRFTWDGVEFDQTEPYFAVRTSVQEISSDRWTEEERRVILEHRWWTVDELRNASEPVLPEELTRLVESVSR